MELVVVIDSGVVAVVAVGPVAMATGHARRRPRTDEAELAPAEL